jgi:hypothetical protein
VTIPDLRAQPFLTTKKSQYNTDFAIDYSKRVR